MAETTVLSSAVRMPTPPPQEPYSPQPSSSRKRSLPSRSPSPKRRRSPPAKAPDTERRRNVGDDREPDERERMLQERFKSREKEDVRRKPMTDEEKQAAAKSEYEKLLTMRSGGTYIPPARLRALQSQITDKTSKEYQRMAWEALKKSINGLINKVNVSNIKHIVPELFAENLVRGRGLFCRSIMKAQAASLPFTPIYAAMAAIVNTKLPQVGELLLNRLVMQFRKAFRRNDKAVCLSSTTFIAHLCNQQVAHETVAAQILLLLLHKPTDDSVEIAVGLTREVGQHLEDMNQKIALAVFDQFRSILHEADIDKRAQYMIEVLFQVRKDKYKDNPAIREELDLVEEEDQITHQVDLDGDVSVEDGLNIFKFDPDYEENEAAYKKLKAEILGEDSDDEDDASDSDVSSFDDDEEAAQDRAMEIQDQTNTDLVNLRRTIYLTIMSSLDFEEACHKLMKVQLPPGQEPELPSMIVECCSQEKTYSKFFGLLGERFAKLNRLWLDLFEQSFAKYYDTIHRYETNRLRNIARFFGHLLATDAIGWHVFSVIHLNEEETTSSSRIFIKILFQELAEFMGLPELQKRMKDDILRPSYDGLFPMDLNTPKNTRFSVNYFTSIGMGILTEEMRDWLKNLPKPAPPPALLARSASRSESVSSYSSYSSYSTSSSRSQSLSQSRSPPPRRTIENGAGVRRGRSRDRSISVSRSSHPAATGRDDRGRRYSSESRSVSRTPPRRNAAARRSPSYSASPPPRSRRVDTTNEGRGRSRSHSAATKSRSRSPRPRGVDTATDSFGQHRGRRSELDARASPPPPRRGNDSFRRRPQTSLSRSPSPYRGRRRSPTRSISYSSPPRRTNVPSNGVARGRGRNKSWSRSPSRSRSPSPPRRDRRRARGNSSSASDRTVSPSPPRKRVKREDSYSRSRSRSRTPPVHRRRNSSSDSGGRYVKGKGVEREGSRYVPGSAGRRRAADFL